MNRRKNDDGFKSPLAPSRKRIKRKVDVSSFFGPQDLEDDESSESSVRPQRNVRRAVPRRKKPKQNKKKRDVRDNYFNKLEHVKQFPFFLKVYASLERSLPQKQISKVDFLKVLKQILYLISNGLINIRECQILLAQTLKMIRSRFEHNVRAFNKLLDRVRQGRVDNNEPEVIVKKKKKEDSRVQEESIEFILEESSRRSISKQSIERQIAEWREAGLKANKLPYPQAADSMQFPANQYAFNMVDPDLKTIQLQEIEYFSQEQMEIGAGIADMGGDFGGGFDYNQAPEWASSQESKHSKGSRPESDPSDPRSGSQHTGTQGSKSEESDNELQTAQEALRALQLAVGRYDENFPEEQGIQKVRKNKANQLVSKLLRRPEVNSSKEQFTKKIKAKLKKFSFVERVLDNAALCILPPVNNPALPSKSLRQMHRERKLRFIAEDIYEGSQRDRQAAINRQFAAQFEEGDWDAGPISGAFGDEPGGGLGGDDDEDFWNLDKKASQNKGRPYDQLEFMDPGRVEKSGYTEKVRVTPRTAMMRAMILLEVSAKLIEMKRIPVTLKSALKSLNLRNKSIQIEALVTLQRQGQCRLFQEDKGPRSPIYLIPSVVLRRHFKSN